MSRRLYSSQKRSEVFHQERNILVMVPKRGCRDDDSQPIKEVFPKTALRDLLVQILVGRRDHPNIDLQWLSGADRFDFAILQCPKDLGLRLEAHVSDFIEEDGPAIGLDKFPRLSAVGAGKRAFFVTEEFGLDQLFGDGCAVDSNQWLTRPVRQVVETPGDQFFAGAGFAQNQDSGR